MSNPFKYVTCDVCNTESFPKREKTVQTNASLVDSIFFSPACVDVMDCPVCGCQIILRAREVVERKLKSDEEAEETEAMED